MKALRLIVCEFDYTAGDDESRWQGCPVPTGHDSPLALYQHVHNTHLALTTPPSSCLWSNCSYTPSSTSDPSLRLAQLTLHTRTHLPSLTSNAFPSSSSDPAPELPPSIFITLSITPKSTNTTKHPVPVSSPA